MKLHVPWVHFWLYLNKWKTNCFEICSQRKLIKYPVSSWFLQNEGCAGFSLSRSHITVYLYLCALLVVSNLVCFDFWYIYNMCYNQMGITIQCLLFLFNAYLVALFEAHILPESPWEKEFHQQLQDKCTSVVYTKKAPKCV